MYDLNIPYFVYQNKIIHRRKMLVIFGEFNGFAYNSRIHTVHYLIMISSQTFWFYLRFEMFKFN